MRKTIMAADRNMLAINAIMPIETKSSTNDLPDRRSARDIESIELILAP